MIFLLDANAWIAHLRGKDPCLSRRLAQTSPDEIRLCSVVLAELLYGAYHSGPAHEAANLALVAQLQNRFASVPFDDSAADHWGSVRHHLAVQGTPIGPNDLMIAAIAIAQGLTLVTHNSDEFLRVPGLTVEDWQAP